MASKLVLGLGICVFTLFLLSPVAAMDDDHAVENQKEALQATQTPSGKILLILFIISFQHFIFINIYGRNTYS